VNQLLAERYRIERLLARGGMADVYLATDERLDRKVAVKVIYPHLASDPRFTEKFIREAKTAAKLNHPNLVNVFDQGTSDGQTYMVMEYVPGMTLRDALDKFGRLSPARALDALDAVLQGLAAAHRAGILHRDLKPENVFLADDGRIKLGDFGLAREASANTSTGSLMGTIAYIAPELLTRGHADARSDVYSAGIMLFEFLTGAQPFGGTDIAHIAHQHTAVGVPAPSTLVPEIPALLDELVLWATAMAPQHRPANAQVLVEVLQRVRTELKAGNGATARLDLPEFAGLAATKVISVDSTMKLGAAAVDENGTVLIGDEYLPEQSGNATAPITGAAGMPDPSATTVLGDFDLGEALHPLEELALKRRKRGKWIAGSMVLVTLLASGAGWWFSAGPGGMTALPDLTSDSVATAEKFLADYTGDIGVTQEFSNSVSTGLVTRTEPKAGELFWRGSHIEIFVSKGVQMVVVPNLKGLTPGEASAKLAAAGFKAGSSQSYYSDAAKGTVFGYLGSDGSKVGFGSTIPLMVSGGALPKVVGMATAEAIKALQSAGIKLSGTPATDYSDTVPTGAVIALRLGADPLPTGGTVSLTTSLGPTTVVLPNFKGETLAAAKLALSSLGLNVTVNTDQLQSSWGVVKVKSMSIPAGTVVKRGTQITISNK
jgi:serine/threonine-protein kinase